MQPVLGQHRLRLGLEPGAQGHELGPVADQLPQLAHRRRGDPGLGQLVEAHAVQELLAVPVVVLHPPVAPVQARRVHQVHGGAFGLEQVDGPVPPVGGFDGHLGVGSGLGQGQAQGHGVVVNAHHAHLVAGLVLSDDERSAQVQVDSHVLFLHGSSLSGSGVFCDPEFPARTVPCGRGPHLHRCRPGRHNGLRWVGCRSVPAPTSQRERDQRSVMTSLPAATGRIGHLPRWGRSRAVLPPRDGALRRLRRVMPARRQSNVAPLPLWRLDVRDRP
jgi:hypothetical protein